MFNWSNAQSMNRSKDASISMMNAGALAIMSAHCASVGVVLVVMSGSGVRPPYYAIGTSGWQPSKYEDIPLIQWTNPQSVHHLSTRSQSSLSYEKSAHHTAYCGTQRGICVINTSSPNLPTHIFCHQLSHSLSAARCDSFFIVYCYK